LNAVVCCLSIPLPMTCRRSRGAVLMAVSMDRICCVFMCKREDNARLAFLWALARCSKARYHGGVQRAADAEGCCHCIQQGSCFCCCCCLLLLGLQVARGALQERLSLAVVRRIFDQLLQVRVSGGVLGVTSGVMSCPDVGGEMQH
jgi:hypothetical protein